MTRVGTYPVAGAAYVRLDVKQLTHAMDLDAWRPLCGRVKAENVLEDDAWGDTSSEPTCSVCRRRDPRDHRIRVERAELVVRGFAMSVTASTPEEAARVGELVGVGLRVVRDAFARHFDMGAPSAPAPQLGRGRGRT